MPLYPQSKMPSMGTKVITVRVGREPNHTDFTVHEDPIRASSAFFQTAFRHEWLESLERVVRLPECDAIDFQIYTHWLYSGLLCAIPSGASSSNGVSSSLVRGYLLGDYLQDASYRDTIIDGLIEWDRDADDAPRTSFLSSWINIVDDKTSEGNPLQNLLVDITVWKTSHVWWTSVISEMPANFVHDVCIGLSTRYRVDGAVFPLRIEASSCVYHSHGDEPCGITEQTKTSDILSSSPPRPRSSSPIGSDSSSFEDPRVRDSFRGIRGYEARGRGVHSARGGPRGGRGMRGGRGG